MIRYALLLSLVTFAAICRVTFAEEQPDETNLVSTALSRVHGRFVNEFATAYWSRGAIVDKHPVIFSSGFLEGDLGAFGRIGGKAFMVNSLSRSGTSSGRQNWFNEFDYDIIYAYDIHFCDGWSLDSWVGPRWDVYPGYHPHAETTVEWMASQSLKNPYVTPYYLFRSAVEGQTWCYWRVGLQRTFPIVERLTFNVNFFTEFGDSRLFLRKYGENAAGDGSYEAGLAALDVIFRLSYSFTEWCSLDLACQEFVCVRDDARDAIDASRARQALKDLTIGYLCLNLKF